MYDLHTDEWLISFVQRNSAVSVSKCLCADDIERVLYLCASGALVLDGHRRVVFEREHKRLKDRATKALKA